MTSFWQDVRYSFRLLAKSPGFTLVALLTLVLGIGANTTIFSWINATLLNPIPGITKTQELVTVFLGKEALSPFPLTYPDFAYLRDETRSLSGLTSFSLNAMNLTGAGKPQRVWGTLASANYFDVLGVKPMLGRGFSPEDGKTPGGAPVVVLSYRFWQKQFGASDSILGQKISLNQHPFTIVGVAPPLFQGAMTGLRADLWVPLMMEQQLLPNGDLIHNHNYFWLTALGRLKPGIRPEQAQQELTLLMQPIVRQFPEEHKGHEAVTLAPLWRGAGANVFFSLLLPMLMAISGVVLLLTCANVANLLLVRSVARRREIAIRLSMGASRWRLLRQLLIESLMLSLAGGCVALLVTLWTSNGLMSFMPPIAMPIDLAGHTDRTMLLATLMISVITGVVFGVLPALRAARIDPAAVLKEESRTAAGGLGKARLTSAIVVAQISLSLLLLICAGLFTRSFVRAQQFNPGFNPDHVLLASYDLFSAGYTEGNGIQFNRQLLERISSLPGVQAVTFGSAVPMGIGAGSLSVKPEGYTGQAHESMEVPDVIVGPDYLRALQIPLAAGRELTAQDTETSQPVAVVNESFARRYWPGQNPLGKRIITDVSDKNFIVVGVAKNSSPPIRNAALAGPSSDPGPLFYLPLYQLYRPTMTLHVRVAGDPLIFAASVEKTVHELNSELPLYNVTTLKTTTQLATMGTRIAGTFVGVFGLLALVLAAVGVYGVISYSTRQRTHELAIRLAFGAERREVFRLVLGQGLRLALVGISVGLVAALLLTRFLANLLYGVTSRDALTFSTVSLLLCLVSLLACFVPAWRATQVDPMTALRHE
ncbi:MAG TPA: ABC transporter permease [Bryobacteraceae bacterium]|nr:ABC transporter permease [Bryobacteraceae bacterium]